MEKIDFENSQQPAINDTNLNLMQTYIETAINAQVSGDTLPIGAIMPFGGGAVPANYLFCNGQAVSRTTYAQLFSVIGTTFGVGDGSTTFNVPNLKGKVPIGYNFADSDFYPCGKTGGTKTVTLTENQIPSHRHTGTSGDWGTSSGQYGVLSNYAGVGNAVYTGYTGGGQAHNNLQPYLVVNYIIKAFQTAGTVATVANTHNNIETNTYSTTYVNGVADYKTTEKICGEWVTGKPLYRKVIDFGALPNNSDKTVAHDIANLKRIVRLGGFAGSSVSKGGITLPHASSSPMSLYADNTYVHVKTTSDATGYTETYIWIEYTKTTD